jgi:FimV-like protein
MDSSRDDIRYKLFELYLMTGVFDKASKIFYQLDRNLEVNDSLRENIQDICQKYNFTPLSEASISDLDDIVINSEPDYPSLNELDDNNIVTLEDHVADNDILNSDINLDAHPEDPNRVVDFISFAPAESISVTDEVVSFSQERVLDFSVVDFKPLDEEAPVDYSDEGRDILISSIDPIADLIPEESTSVIVSDDNTFDEKLNLARMYFHIEESDKAKDILNQLLENKNLSENLKLEISKLKAEMGING